MLVITARLRMSLLWAHKSSNDAHRQTKSLNQSQNDQKIYLTTFTTITHSHMQILWHVNIAFSRSVDYFFSLRDKSQCWMGPHITCKQWTHVYQNSSKWRLCSRCSAGVRYPVMSELQLCKVYTHAHTLDTMSHHCIINCQDTPKPTLQNASSQRL
jgi:hypothetical protein